MTYVKLRGQIKLKEAGVQTDTAEIVEVELVPAPQLMGTLFHLVECRQLC